MNQYIVKARDTEKEIVNLFHRGDEKAISLVYKNYSSSLYGVITKVVVQEELAKEVLQDTFLKIWRNAKRYDPEKGRLFTWMMNIARRSAIDMVRSAAYKKDYVTDSMDAPTYEDRNSGEEMNLVDSGLEKVINSMDEKYRNIIDLIYFKGYSHREIEEELQIPLGTVKSRVRLAIKLLREKLKEEDDGKDSTLTRAILMALILSTI